MSFGPRMAGVATTGVMEGMVERATRPVARLLPGFVTCLIVVLVVAPSANGINELSVTVNGGFRQ